MTTTCHLPAGQRGWYRFSGGLGHQRRTAVMRQKGMSHMPILATGDKPDEDDFILALVAQWSMA